MSLFDERKKQFIETIKETGNLPVAWETKFIDGHDQRVWFDKIKKIPQFQNFVDEVNNLLNENSKKLLTDKEKEIIFMNTISKIKRIPFERELYFDDNQDMYTWYINYVNKHRNYEELVYNNLPEYINLNLSEIWPDIRQEFNYIIRKIKRIPNHGEVKLQRGIDVRVIFSKLEKYDPQIVEEIKLYLQAQKKKQLTREQRISEFFDTVSKIGYIPALQECRFSDGCDMFTWYLRYKVKLPSLEEEALRLIKNLQPKTKVNIYLIPNFRKSGGKFYTVCSNTGEVLDISSISSYEEAKKLDSDLKKKGGIILKRDEEIESVSFGRSKK